MVFNVIPCSNEEELQFRQFASSPSVLQDVFGHIAPNIHGHVDIKKAVACLLFGGSRKVVGRSSTRNSWWRAWEEG